MRFSEALALGMTFPCVRMEFYDSAMDGGCLLTNAARALGWNPVVSKTGRFAGFPALDDFLVSRYPWLRVTPFDESEPSVLNWIVGAYDSLDRKGGFRHTPEYIIDRVRELEDSLGVADEPAPVEAESVEVACEVQ